MNLDSEEEEVSDDERDSLASFACDSRAPSPINHLEDSDLEEQAGERNYLIVVEIFVFSDYSHVPLVQLDGEAEITPEGENITDNIYRISVLFRSAERGRGAESF